MPKASPLQPSFTAGEFSPKLYGRTDSERYKTGLATCLNYLPTIEGPIVRRPGTKYSGVEARDPSIPPVLIPFEVSAVDSYMLEFGEGYIRFFKDGAQVTTINSSAPISVSSWQGLATQTFNSYTLDNTAPVDGGSRPAGSPLEMSSPFNSSDIYSLNYSMNNGELYITSGRLPPYKMTRSSDYKWAIVPINPTLDGPYLPFNTIETTGDSYNVTVTPLTVGTSLLNKVATTTIEAGPRTAVVRSSPVWGSNSSTVTLHFSTASNHNFYVGQNVFSDQTQNWPGGGALLQNRPYIVSEVINERGFAVVPKDQTNLLENMGGALTASSFIYPVLATDDYWNRHFAVSISGKRFWGTLKVLSSNPWFGTFSVYETPIPSGGTYSTWQLGYMMNNEAVGKYPKYNTFHQGRFILANTEGRENYVAASVVGTYEDFRTSNSSYVSSDSNALNFALSSQKANPIQWVASDSNGLLVGAYNSEWKVSPSSQAAALTPTNINAVETSYFGSDSIPAVKTGNAILYVQRSARKIRELNYFFQFNSYKSTDLTQLSDHITAPSVAGLANQTETIPAVWALRSDGQLLSMVYGRDDETLKAGWARHELGGQSDSGGSPPKVLSMAVIAGSAAQFDQLWMCTRRFVNGTSAVHIEYMTKPFQDDTLLEDAIFLDCAGTYDNPKAITNISIAGSSIVTCPSHGFSDGDQVQITKVVGLNTSVVDINGYEFNSNRVNYGIFRVASTAANTFFLTDVNNGSSYIDTRGYSVYVSGGEARKLVSTIVGATWLTGETVGVLADGRVHPDAVVGSGGVISLSYPAAKVHVGLKYNSDGKTLRLDAGAGDGTSIGKLRRPSRVAFQLYNVGEISVGMSFTNLVPLSDVESFKSDNSSSDSKIPLFNGIARESLESQHDYDGQICFRQSAPLPGMIQSITQMIEENDV